MKKRRVAVVGATGIAGQQFLTALADHPWFEVAALAASARSAGKSYAASIRDPKTGVRRWWCEEEPPAAMLELPVIEASSLDASSVDIVFSAVESDAARELEPVYARTTGVVSTASAFRYDDDVPIIVPGVNFDHHRLIDLQRQRRGWKGFIVPTPNCTATGLVITLKPLLEAYGLRLVMVTSMQGISGAGRSPGVLALDIVDNIIPFIPSEEEKVARETVKILGTAGAQGLGISPAPLRVGATWTRAAVTEGHTESVVVATERRCTPAEAKRVMQSYGAELAALALPSAPQHLILVHDDPYRPQPRLDRDAESGMATSVGRLRADEAIENGLKYLLVSHNAKMGAAKGAVLAAEFLASAGYC